MLTEFLDTSNEWIVERTGIKQRQVISTEKLEQLAAEAARNAIENAEMQITDIDYIICSNVVNEYVTPSMSCLVQKALGSSCPCLDINAACSGFVYALDIAQSFIESGVAHNVLIVCAEEPTRMVNWQDRSTCVLFGDGAGAVVITKGAKKSTVRVSSQDKCEALYYEKMLEPTPYVSKEERDIPLVMKGQEVFKTAVSSSLSDIKRVLSASGTKEDEVAFYLLHQANMRIIDAICKFMNQSPDKFPHNLERYGNTSSASIPILLDEMNRAKRFKKGDKLVFSAFGAGFTTGACMIEWDKE